MKLTELQKAIKLRSSMGFLEASKLGNEEVFKAYQQVAHHNTTSNHKRCICTEEEREELEK